MYGGDELYDDEITSGPVESEPFDLHAAIAKQRERGQEIIAPLSMLRCSECGDLLDAFGCCVIHGLLDTEARDGYEG